MAATAHQHTLMVCWKHNDPEDEAKVREVDEAIKRQKDIPGVLSVEAGPRTAQVDWEGPETSFDYGMVLTFDNFDSARAYVPHQIHQDLVQVILRLGTDIHGFWIDPK